MNVLTGSGNGDEGLEAVDAQFPAYERVRMNARGRSSFRWINRAARLDQERQELGRQRLQIEGLTLPHNHDVQSALLNRPRTRASRLTLAMNLVAQ